MFNPFFNSVVLLAFMGTCGYKFHNLMQLGQKYLPLFQSYWQLHWMDALQTLYDEKHYQLPFSTLFRVLHTSVFCLSNWRVPAYSPFAGRPRHTSEQLSLPSLPVSGKHCINKTPTNAKTALCPATIHLHWYPRAKADMKNCLEVFPTSTDRWSWHRTSFSDLLNCLCI